MSEPEKNEAEKSEASKATKFKLTRDGERDLVFTGERLASVSDHNYQGPKQSRWTEIRIFKTRAGALVAGVLHRTCWQGEHDTFHAEICESPAEVYAELLDWSGDVLTDLAKEALRDAGLDDQTVEAIA